MLSFSILSSQVDLFSHSLSTTSTFPFFSHVVFFPFFFDFLFFFYIFRMSSSFRFPCHSTPFSLFSPHSFLLVFLCPRLIFIFLLCNLLPFLASHLILLLIFPTFSTSSLHFPSCNFLFFPHFVFSFPSSSCPTSSSLSSTHCLLLHPHCLLLLTGLSSSLS